MDEAIRLYGRRLYGLCRSLCGGVQDADDLYQDTWLKALDYLERHGPPENYGPWLAKICVNLYRSRLRRLARSPIRAIGEGEELPAPEGEDYSGLHAAVEGLPEKLRLAVILYYFQDLDIAAAAKILRVPAGTVKSRLNRARKLLKEALHDEESL